MSNLARPPQTQQSQGLLPYLEMPKVATRLSEKLGFEEAKKFKAALSSAVINNEVLLRECTPESVINAALIGHSLGLPPSPQLGYYYLVPFNNKNKRCKEATFQVGYRGYVQLAMRSGFYKKLNVLPIKEGEFVSYNPLTEDLKTDFEDDQSKRAELPTVGYCAYFEYTNGFSKLMYWTKEKMQSHADSYSPAYSLEKDKLLKAGKIPSSELWKYSSFWYKNFDDMACKTMLRQILSKWGIMSVELQSLYEADVDREPFDTAQQNAHDFIEGEAGSSEISDGVFEEQTPEPQEDELPKPEFLN